MHPNNDPLGACIIDYQNGKTDAEVTVYCDIAEPSKIPAETLFRDFNSMPESEVVALENCKGNVLDVGAGAGCHSLVLQDKGLNVKAIDISLNAIKAMEKNGIKNLEQTNFFDIKNEKYDTILLLMNGIGIVGTIDGLNDFFKLAKKLLNKDGQIIFDSTDIAYMFTEEDGSMYINLNANYYGEVSYTMEYDKIMSDPFNWLYVDYEVMKSEAEKNGFECGMIFENDNHNYVAKLKLKTK